MWEIREKRSDRPQLWYDGQLVIDSDHIRQWDREFWMPLWNRVSQKLIGAQPLTQLSDLRYFNPRERLLFLGLCLKVDLGL
jgi:hypothetical protein